MTGSGQGGGKKASEMKAEHQEFLDAQPTTTRCAYCRWKFKGSAAEGRLEAERHRRDEHPERAQGGALAEAFERRKRRRKPWSLEEVLDAFLRFYGEFNRWPVPNDVPLVPYLPSMNTVQKVPGSWVTAREKAQAALSGPVTEPPAETDDEPPTPPAAPQAPARRARAAVSETSEQRLRRVLHELVDAVVDHLGIAA